MKSSEKNLLAVLLVAVIAVGYYELPYQSLKESTEATVQERDTTKAKKEQAERDIASIPTREKQVKTFNTKIIKATEGFYPEMSQEKIILQIQDYLEQSGLKRTYSFSEPVTGPVTKIVNTTEKGESNLATYVDKYNKAADIDDKDSEADETTAEPKSSTDETEESSDTTTTCENLKLDVNFEGSYDALKKFMVLIENDTRWIVESNLTIKSINATDVSGVLSLEFYGIPKVGTSDDTFLDWTITGTYGKTNMFSGDGASGAYNDSTLEADADTNDFKGIVRSYKSEIGPVAFGKTNDVGDDSYLVGTSNDTTEVEVELSEKNGKFYYSYKVGNTTYPTTGTKEFTPYSGDICIEIVSEPRSDSSDKAGMKLKIVNNTSKKVKCVISNDDTSKPRVSTSSSGDGTVEFQK